MKSVLTYWLIGCVAVGFVIGRAISDCPDDEFKSGDAAIAVAMWPAYIVAAATMSMSGHKSKPFCKDGTPWRVTVTR